MRGPSINAPALGEDLGPLTGTLREHALAHCCDYSLFCREYGITRIPPHFPTCSVQWPKAYNQAGSPLFSPKTYVLLPESRNVEAGETRYMPFTPSKGYTQRDSSNHSRERDYGAVMLGKTKGMQYAWQNYATLRAVHESTWTPQWRFWGKPQRINTSRGKTESRPQ
jgi:hypothetical protein